MSKISILYVKGGENMTDFEKAFEQNRELVFKFLLKLSCDVSLAEELTQETFFRAYMNYAGLREREKISSWLMQVAKNTYFAWFNEHKKISEYDDALVTDEGNVEDEFTQKELGEQALKCLHELGEPYKEVFMLCVFGGLSLTDISKLFGKSESWARVTFYRAKQKLSEGLRYNDEL